MPPSRELAVTAAPRGGRGCLRLGRVPGCPVTGAARRVLLVAKSQSNPAADWEHREHGSRFSKGSLPILHLPATDVRDGSLLAPKASLTLRTPGRVGGSTPRRVDGAAAKEQGTRGDSLRTKGLSKRPRRPGATPRCPGSGCETSLRPQQCEDLNRHKTSRGLGLCVVQGDCEAEGKGAELEKGEARLARRPHSRDALTAGWPTERLGS